MALTSEYKTQHLQHILLDNIGEEGQEKIANAKVLVIGLGGLGSAACVHLTTMGVGRLGMMDHDIVDIDVLPRQPMHALMDVGKSKIASGKAKLKHFNPNLIIDEYFEELTENNIETIIQNYDFVIDAMSDIGAKFLINKFCVKANIPFSFANVFAYKGQTMTIIPHKSACLACAFSKQTLQELKDSEKGILGVVPGIMGCIQAVETIKYIIGSNDLLTNTLLCADFKTMNFQKISINTHQNCPICSKL